MLVYPKGEAEIEKVEYKQDQYRRIDYSHDHVQWERFESESLSWKVITGEEKDELEDEYLGVDMSGIAIG